VRSPAPARLVAPIEPHAEDAPSRRPIVRVALLATAVGLLAFLLVQALLAAYNLGVVREAIDRGMLQVSERDRLSLSSRLAPALIYGALSYVMLALVGSAVASRGHRVLFVLPATVYVFATVFVGRLFQPEAIGTEWSLDCYSEALTCAGPWFGHPWFGPLVDLAVVLVPGWVITRSVRPRRWPGRTDAAVVAAILVSAGGVAIAGWTIAVTQSYLDLRTILPIAALGLALGVARPWWPWLHVLFAGFAAGAFGWVMDWIFWPYPMPAGFTFWDDVPYILGRVWPIALIGLIASTWRSLAWVMRKLQERPLRLAIAVNVLNLVDALMTLVAVRSGGAYESNPVVRLVGLPAKVVLVGLLTWLLYRRKSSALVWPFAALLLVAGYHVAGMVVNGWR
jgi:hypothetical protein